MTACFSPTLQCRICRPPMQQEFGRNLEREFIRFARLTARRSVHISNMTRARVVLVGTGRMGAIRAKIVYGNPRFEFCGVVDINKEAAEKLATNFNTISFGSLKEAIDHFGKGDSALNGIIICTPTFAHDPVIREAAEYGLHIFSEKPVDETAEKVSGLFDHCEKHNVKLCCGFQRRFDLSYKAVADAVRGGKIGKALSASIFFADHPCPPIEFLLTGGDIFMDLSAHDIDYIRWALNDEVDSVYATGSSSTEVLKNAKVYDNATMVLSFSRGAIVTLTMSRSASYGYDQRCEIFGSEGLASVNNEFADSSVISNEGGIQQSRLKHSFPERFDAAFAKELDVFADCIIENAEWPIFKADCISTQKIADAARKSAELQKVINL